MPHIIKTPLAEQDLIEIWQYIALDNEERATVLLQRFHAKLTTLLLNPLIGRNRPELLPELRSFPIGNYIVFYRPYSEGIEVIRVLHGARDIEAIFN